MRQPGIFDTIRDFTGGATGEVKVHRNGNVVLYRAGSWLYSHDSYPIGVRISNGKYLMNTAKPPSNVTRSHLLELRSRLSSYNGVGLPFPLLERVSARYNWTDIVLHNSRFDEAVMTIYGETYGLFMEPRANNAPPMGFLAKVHPVDRSQHISDVERALVPKDFRDNWCTRKGAWYFQEAKPEDYSESLIVKQSPRERNGQPRPGVALFTDDGVKQRRHLEPESHTGYGNWTSHRVDEMYLDEHVYVRGTYHWPGGVKKFPRWHKVLRMNALYVWETH